MRRKRCTGIENAYWEQKIYSELYRKYVPEILHQTYPQTGSLFEPQRWEELYTTIREASDE